MSVSRRSSIRTKLIAALLAAVGLTTAVSVGFVSAGHETGDVPSYTGCLTKGGGLMSIKVGDQPAKACEPGAVVAHFSGGDITEIVAGTGLTGGATNGAAAIALAPSYRLPQGCTAGQVAEWGASGWSCANDDTGTAYTAGDGLVLNGTEFSVKELYQLPQDCELGQSPVLNAGLSAQLRDWGCATHTTADQACPSGQFARAVDEDGELGCATPTAGSGGGSTAYLAVEHNPVDGSERIGILATGEDFEMVRLDLPPGSYTFHASGTVDREPEFDLGGESIVAFCDLTAAGIHLHNSDVFVDDWGSVSVSLDSAAHLPSGGAVSVTCNTGSDGMTGQYFRLVATSVGALG